MTEILLRSPAVQAHQMPFACTELRHSKSKCDTPLTVGQFITFVVMRKIAGQVTIALQSSVLDQPLTATKSVALACRQCKNQVAVKQVMSHSQKR